MNNLHSNMTFNAKNSPFGVLYNSIARLPFDGGLLLTLGLCLFTLWPLFYRPGLPNGDDVLYHVYRAAEMDRSWANGLLTPRWAESFYMGYGSPVFHYYAGASYYATSLLLRLFALNVVDGLRLLIALAMLGGGAGMYYLARQFSGKFGGVVAAVCYAYSPYLLLTEPYTRGAYPEMSALALFPWIMALFAALLRTGGWRVFALAAFSLAALILTHNLMAVAITGVIAAWLLWVLLARIALRATAADLYPLRGLLALALGVGLAAFFWLPIFVERDAVRLENLTAIEQLNYRNFFVPLGEMLAFSPRVDAGAINGLRYQFNFGVAQWALALIAVIVAVMLYARTKRAPAQSKTLLIHNSFFGLAALLCIGLMLPASTPLWDALPPLAFLQFPWRLLGLVTLFLATLASLNALWIEKLPRTASRLLAAALVILPIALALPTLYVDEWEHETVDTSVAAYHTAELAGLQRGTTFSNEYLPRQVIAEPSATQHLLDDYADGHPINRANLAALPQDVSLTLISSAPQENTWRVSGDSAFTLELLTFDFPGWTAEIDGQVVPITPSQPHGLITLPVPAGDHTIRVYLGSTPPRTLGTIISLLALGGVIAAALWLRASKKAHSVEARDSVPAPLQPHLQIGLLTGGAVSLLLVITFMRPGLAWVESPRGEVIVAQHQVVYNFGDQLRLLGYDLNGGVFYAGDTLEVTLYWDAPNGPTDYGYASFVHLSQGGPPAAQADKLNPAGEPTLKWPADGYFWDSYSIPLPPNIAPGVYNLVIGVYTCDTRPAGECGNGDRPSVTDAAGNVVGDAALLTTIEVR